MRKPVLSRRQQGILRFLYSYSQSNGFYPTIREICEGTQTSSTSVVKYHLEQLVELGYLNHSPRRSRSNTLSQKAYELLQVSPTGELRADAHNALEQEIRQLRLQIEQLKRSHQQEIEAYTQERAQLVGEIGRLRLAVPA